MGVHGNKPVEEIFMELVKNKKFSILKGGRIVNTKTNNEYSGRFVSYSNRGKIVAIAKSKLGFMIQEGRLRKKGYQARYDGVKDCYIELKPENVKGTFLSTNVGLTHSQVAKVRKSLCDLSATHGKIAKSFGITEDAVSRAKRGAGVYGRYNTSFQNDSICKVRNKFKFGQFAPRSLLSNAQANKIRKEFMRKTSTSIVEFCKGKDLSVENMRNLLKGTTYNFADETTKQCAKAYKERITNGRQKSKVVS